MIAKKLFLACILALALPTASHAVTIADYTAFPPFLPRVVSPNILFLLDYSYSMVRPAYGVCSTVTDVAGTSSTTATDYLSDCRNKFSHLSDDYDPTQPYAGYFNNGNPNDQEENPVYSDAGSKRYTWNGTEFVISNTGDWNGNWLNWLTMTQFDVLKKVTVGGDITPTPEGANPDNMKLLSNLRKSMPPAGQSSISIYKTVEIDKCIGDSPHCTEWPTVVYDAGEFSPPGSVPQTTVFGAANINDGISSAQNLPFKFSFYGNTFNQVYISTNGWISFTAPGASHPTNLDLPNVNAPANLIAPFWDNFLLDSSKSSSIKTYTLPNGGAPNRIFVISFNNLYHVDDSGKANAITFQVLLYERSNHIKFQYASTTSGGGAENYGQGRSATVGIQNGDGTSAREYLYGTGGTFSGTLLSNELAIFGSPHITYAITNTTSPTSFAPAAPLSGSYPVKIGITGVSCTSAPHSYKNTTTGNCYDHQTMGLVQDFRDGEMAGLLGFRLALMQLNDEDGGKVTKHFNQADSGSVWSSIMADTRGQRPTDYTPLAEALHVAQGYFRQDSTYALGLNVANSWDNDGTAMACTSNTNTYDPFCYKSAAQKVPCSKSFVILVSSGHFSHDVRRNAYNDFTLLSDKALLASGWKAITGDSSTEGTRANQGWLDNVAYQMHTTDLRTDDPLDAGDQTVGLYAINTYGEGTGNGTDVLKQAALYGGFRDIDGNGVFDSGEDDPASPRNYLEPGRGGVKAKIVKAVIDILKNSASGTSVSVLSTSAGGEGALYQAYFYPARLDDDNQQEDRRWPGYLRSFFIDRYQNLRDDHSAGSPDKGLVFNEDRVVEMRLDPTDNAVKVDLYNDSNGDGILTSSERTPKAAEGLSMDSITSLWEGGKLLAQRDDKSLRKIYLWLPAAADLNSVLPAAEGDFGLTATSKTFSLAPSKKTTLRPYLRANATLAADAVTTLTTADQEAENVINYILGKQVNGYNQVYRSRCVNVDATTRDGCPAGSGHSSWPLGDIVFSTPTLVIGPMERYDLIYPSINDGYVAFRNQWKARRNVVYVGANDGLLHAFNAGIYKEGNKSGTTDVEHGWFEANPSGSSNSYTLGEEMWAFLPYDNLPHMTWLACNGTGQSPSACGGDEYTHVYYVDHRPKVTDARIFNDTATGTTGLIDGQEGVAHPNGWGTILIMPMRLGGGAMNVDLNGSGSTEEDEKFRSAYYAFDITDTDKPPKLLWRFTHNNLGFTTSYPGIVRIKNGSSEEWFMVIGSGPDNQIPGVGRRAYGFAESTQDGRVFVVNLRNLATTVIDADAGISGKQTMGDPTVVDVNRDFSADVIYIGSTINPTNVPEDPSYGRIYRLKTNKDINPANWQISKLFDPDPSLFNADPDNGKEMGPLLVGPSVAMDKKNNLWVYFGTGQLRNTADMLNSDQQTFYALKDGCWGNPSITACSTTYSLADLLNTTDVKIYQVSPTRDASEQVSIPAALPAANSPCNSDMATSCSYSTFYEKVQTKKGWYRSLRNSSTGPSERILSRSSVIGGVVLFTTYIPAGDLCSVLGDSYLYAMFYETGTAYTKSIIGAYRENTATGDPVLDESGNYAEAPAGTPASGEEHVLRDNVLLGPGMPTSVGVAIGETTSGFIQQSTGEIKKIETEAAYKLKSGPTSWREERTGGGTVGLESIYKHIVK